MASDNDILEIIAIPIDFPNRPLGFSINFRTELKNYLLLLKEITAELSPLVTNDNQANTIAFYLDNMRTKADRFITRKHPLYDYSLGKDVLIGLHLLLLDSFYTNTITTPTPNVTISRLLETRNSSIEMPSKFYPKNYRADFYNNLIDSLTVGKKMKWNSSSTFKKAFNGIEFLREHIFELSQVGEKLLQDERILLETIHKYHEFLKIKEVSSPSKEIDFIYHNHLLNPHNFIQDCKRISGFIKVHNFNFQP
ncbi:predicted protein [Naegleria gruberi]|uniref:Predicted protein n=1 Tax=Naegleria gruberi TaxID=5762 RepID=D2VGC6_NAEGR|nr:uncharacterized protein NAEGRDRAFT_67930 [Naegleria gruberi]EFC43939.1 predicted protein [Naegleria gruberi]|eukprot:XP_002676683.1 predicted protein [Naegleria gruberi strain NEG-M]